MNIQASEQEQPRPIESLSEAELRREATGRINTTLGDLPFGPVADGAATIGYKRAEQGLPGLGCSYFQYLKAYQKEEQVGVQIALLGIGYAHLLDIHNGWIKRYLQKQGELSEQEQQDLKVRIQAFNRRKEGLAKDGIALSDNRYYFIPLDPIQPAFVSTESFFTRAHQINPEAAETFLPPDLLAAEFEKKAQDKDPISGQPLTKIANLQDFRDAVAIVRNTDWFVADIIKRTPKKYWGRPGLTY